MNYFKILYMMILMYMSFLGWSSNNWLIMWFIMEIMFLFFVGVTSLNLGYNSVELIMKYYIVQIFFSIILLGVMIFSMFNMLLLMNMLMFFLMLFKLGLFPFHFWLIMIVGKMGWLSFYLMSSLLKIMPILMIYYMLEILNYNMLILVSVVIGSMMGINNTLIQKLMSYSSMIHLCWLLVALNFSIIFFEYYFCSYLYMLATVCYLFNLVNVYYINQSTILMGSLFYKFMIFFLVLSLAGFPPFMGFISKWIIMYLMILLNLKFLFFFMLFFSVFSIYFYLQLFFYIMMIFGLSLKWYKFNYSMSFLFLMMSPILFFYIMLYFI
uniref:NADH-ubiquinone oxidoreductase chain 2 n=1 Tax=Aleyrodes shizuokensis TaxID=860392 RepID=A0A7T1K7N7_9HEMI|nr:NADH dehydrogenase subunit 2 [Aleyrodes shizuokensis]QPO06184.1 NADH dehydrogenase subunit 2 [Aleyrodes shizuokensis]